ncbi:MAG: ATP-binding protein, partial [Pseudomonadales bacterium]|nr:ATP-binding protein [Pseudomonadales bacterium]
QAQIDKNGLHQVLSNLLTNASEATASGGTVTLAFSHQHFRNDVSGFEISVGDTGAGLPESVLADLRGKKETIKGGGHQGIGLSVVYRLVAEMGAELDLRTSSKGTLFSLFLHTDE